MSPKGNMKRKHLLLFIVCCVLIYVSELFAGALIAVALIFQMNLLFEGIVLTKQSQITAFKLFFLSAPLFFFLGGIHSFISLYFKDGQWLYLLFALVITFFLFFLVNFFCFFVFRFLETSHFNISVAYQKAFIQIKNAKKGLFAQTFFLLVLSFVPYLTSEWKIIFSLMAFQLYRHRLQLKPVFGF